MCVTSFHVGHTAVIASLYTHYYYHTHYLTSPIPYYSGLVCPAPNISKAGQTGAAVPVNLLHLPNLCDYKLLCPCIEHAFLGKVHLEDK